MAFDFPSNPAPGDEYASGGATYFWTGTTWDLQTAGTIADKVDKAGDTMTGQLNINRDTSAGEWSIAIAPDNGLKTMTLSPSSTPHSGIIEFWMPDGVTRRGYIGYGAGTDVATNYLNINPEGGKIHINGAGLAMQENAGIHWGNTSARSNPLELNEGICLYGWGTTSKFGFSITSGTLNYVVENVGNIHCFRVGAENVMDIRSDGVRIPGGNLNVTGTSSFTGAISAAGKITSTVAKDVIALQLNDGARIDFSSGCIIRKVHGSNQFQHHTNAGQVYVFHISGFGDAWVIDTVGATGNSFSATAPEALALGKELGVARRKPETETTLEGVDVVKMLAAVLLKVKKLEAEVATLRGRK